MRRSELTRRRFMALSGALTAVAADGAEAVQSAPAGGPHYPPSALEHALGAEPKQMHHPYGNALRYGADPTGTADSTAAIQSAIDVAWSSGAACHVPAGVYSISAGLIINQASARSEYRGGAFTLHGDGSGNAEATQDLRTTVIRTSSDITMLRYAQYRGERTNSGNYFIEGIRWIQTSPAAMRPVIQLDVLGAFSRWSQSDIYNAGAGDGLRCLMFTQALIERSTIVNRDWIAADPWLAKAVCAAGGTVINGRNLYVCTAAGTREPPTRSARAAGWSPYARSGVGVNILSQYSAGKGTIQHVSVRGYEVGFSLGTPGGSNSLLGVTLRECDVSNVAFGAIVNVNMENTLIDHCYFEGVERTNILDNGLYTCVRDNVITTASYLIGIDGSNAGTPLGGGFCVYDGNYVALGTQYVDGAARGVPDGVGIVVNATAAIPMTVTNNTIAWGHSGAAVANVVGLRLTGVDSMITYFGNKFSPNAGWSGGGRTAAFENATTSSTGSRGEGDRGFGFGMDGSGTFPSMSRGALGLWRNAAMLGNAAVASGVLTLGQASYHVLDFDAAQAVTALDPHGCGEGQVFVLRFVNGAATLVQGSHLKLIGSVSFTSGPNGSTHTFIMDDNVAYEIARAVY